jgi:hypothetical protein
MFDGNLSIYTIDLIQLVLAHLLSTLNDNEIKYRSTKRKDQRGRKGKHQIRHQAKR